MRGFWLVLKIFLWKFVWIEYQKNIWEFSVQQDPFQTKRHGLFFPPKKTIRNCSYFDQVKNSQNIFKEKKFFYSLWKWKLARILSFTKVDRNSSRVDPEKFLFLIRDSVGYHIRKSRISSKNIVEISHDKIKTTWMKSFKISSMYNKYLNQYNHN